MVELVVRELRHEIDAYQDFCDYRASAAESGRRATNVSREEWLDRRRKELQTRMRRRRESEQRETGKTPIGLFD